MPNVKNYVLLETITVGAAGASSVTFNNIPQTGYTDLKIVHSTRCTRSSTTDLLRVQFNGSSTGYSNRHLQGDGTNASSGTASYIWAYQANGATSTANTFGNGEIYIPNYTSSNNKSVSCDGVQETNATAAYMGLTANLWSNTAAITSITLSLDSGSSFVQYSTFSLYGLAAVGTTPTIAPKAAGGDIIQTDGTYWYHAFITSGTFTPAKALTCDVLVVAGGGAGDSGGGGAGGVIAFSSQSILTAQTVTVGGGGATVSSGDANSSGSDSQFGSLTAAVGGGAGRYTLNGVSGGSGGGGGYPSKTGGAGTSGQGFAGGTGGATGGGGGGGGAGAVGSNGSGNVGGTGGAGTNSVTNWGSLSSALTTTGTGSGGYIAGGGGGGVNSGVATVVAGGSGGGGSGNTGSTAGRPGTAPTNGVANTGSGGGGIYNNYPAGAGGSGLVIVRYLITA